MPPLSADEVKRLRRSEVPFTRGRRIELGCSIDWPRDGDLGGGERGEEGGGGEG